jgi:hypothetical protein
MKDKIILLHQMLVRSSINSNENNENEITKLLQAILTQMSKDYVSYRGAIAYLIDICEKNKDKSIIFLLHLYITNFEPTFESKEFLELVTPKVNLEKINIRGVLAKLSNQLSKNVKKNKNKKIKLLSSPIDVKGFSRKELNAVLDSTRILISDAATNIHWTIQDVTNNYFFLALARPAAIATQHLEFYYLIFGVFFDRLNTSQHYQKARDLSEEVLSSSFKDNLPEYGFYLSFRAFSTQSNPVPAMIYANLLLARINSHGTTINRKLMVEIISESLRVFRNIGYYQGVDDLYKIVFTYKHIDEYEFRNITFLYLSSLMLRKDDDTITLTREILEEWLEPILEVGTKEIMPWLNYLYTIKANYSLANYISGGLWYFEESFEKSLTDGKLSKSRDILFGNIQAITPQYLSALENLSQTRGNEDFTNDVKQVIVMANRLVEESVACNDSSSYLLAMIIKSDFSFVFSQKETEEIVRLDFIGQNEFDIYIQTVPNFIENEIGKNHDIIWLALSKHKLYELSFNSTSKFRLRRIEEWSKDDFNKWNRNKWSHYEFNTSVKEGKYIRLVFPEEFEAQTNEFSRAISFYNSHNEHKKPLLIIKDVELASWAHNLLLDNNGRLILESQPIINILSIEWLLRETPSFTGLHLNYSKSVWIPLEAGDWTLHQLHDKLSNTLSAAGFNINSGYSLPFPLSSDVNVVIAHGDKNIHSFDALFVNDEESIYNINKIIGKGKLLILFVCHSGSSDKNYFDYKVSSFIRKFFELGYEAVIAPFWALSIDIPPIWLPKFLEHLDSGSNASDAFYHASLAVKEALPTPAAWACLHYYGNPDFCVHNTINNQTI